MDYQTADRTASGEFTEKKSRFIGSISPVRTEAEAVAFIQQVKKTHPQARHHVYAYILRDGNLSRYSDAGEPSGTGGQPALQVLVREGLTDVCVVVTRYFGGVLLGAGGLTRAYARGAKVAVDAAASRSCGSAVYTQCAAPMRSISACYPCWNRRHAQSVRACLPMKSPSRSPCARRIRREYWKSSRKPAPVRLP